MTVVILFKLKTVTDINHRIREHKTIIVYIAKTAYCLHSVPLKVPITIIYNFKEVTHQNEKKGFLPDYRTLLLILS